MNRRMTALAVAAIAALAAPAIAQTETTFTYQGRLDLLGEPYTGTADYRFTLWDAATAGNQIGAQVALDGANVDDGLFTAHLDFGADALSGQRWLEISVRTPAWDGKGDEPPFTTLDPRQAITRSPYSIQTRGIFVNEAGSVGIGTTEPSARLDVKSPSFLVTQAESDNTVGTWLRLLNNSIGGHNWNLISSGTDNGEGPGHLLFRDQTMGGTRMVIQSGGNVGIGTAGPAARLTVDRSNATATVARFQDNDTPSSAVDVRATSFRGEIQGVASGNPGTLILNPDGGNVGIGTDPSEKLDVAGTARVDAVRFPDGSIQTRAAPVALRRTGVNFGPINPGTRSAVNGTLPGAEPGDAVVISVDGDVPHPFILFGAYVPAAGEYRFLFHNVGSQTVDPPLMTFTVMAFRGLAP